MRGRSTPSGIRHRLGAWPSAIRRTFAAGGVLVATGALTLALAPGSTGTGLACPFTQEQKEAGYLPRFFPPRTSGDRDFGGHGPAITVSAKRELIQVSPGPDRLEVVVKMKAQETRSDWSTANGEGRFTLYTSPPGCDISSVGLGGEEFDSNGYLARPLLANPYTLEAGNRGISHSFVRGANGYKVWDDRVGKDIGSYTSVQVFYRAFTVHLVEEP
jgi:hypothetical protein